MTTTTAPPSASELDLTIFDEPAEQALLAVMLTNDDACSLAAAKVRPEDFWHPGRRRVCAAVLELHAGGAAVDSVTVSAACPKDRDLVGYLAGLVEPVAAHAGSYISTLISTSAKRSLLGATQQLESAVRSTNGDVGALLGTAETILSDAVSDIRVRVGDEDEHGALRASTVAELASMPDAHVEWVLGGYFARGMLTQLTGLPKEGKSTFAAAAAAAVSEGREFCGLQTRKVPVLYYTEEGRQSFLAIMRRICAADAENFHVLLRSETFGQSWADVCHKIRDLCRLHGIGLLIVDTFTDLAGLAGEDENVAGPVLEAIGHLRPIAADGSAVVILRHDRKEQGGLIESGRGSGAFAGAMDVLMALRKKGESQREILGVGRPEGIPDSMFVTFDGTEYSAADDPRRQRDLDLERQLLSALPHDESGALGIDAIAALLGRSTKTAMKQLKRLRGEGAVQCGRGKGNVTAPQAFGWWAP